MPLKNSRHSLMAKNVNTLEEYKNVNMKSDAAGFCYDKLYLLKANSSESIARFCKIRCAVFSAQSCCFF